MPKDIPSPKNRQETYDISRTGDPDFMSTLARGLAVIQAFSQQRQLMSISQISQKTGIPRAAVRRCLYTLSELGFVHAEDGRNYSLRPRILALGHVYLASTPLAKAAQPVLRHVSNQLHESCSIGILDGDDILYIARASTTRIMTIDLDIGSRLPALCTSMGRVLIAHLPEQEQEGYLDRMQCIQYTPYTRMTREAIRAELTTIREQGFAIMDQELEIGLRSIALPIFSPDKRPVAALNVGAHAGRISVSDMKERIRPMLEDTVQELGLLIS